MLTTIHVDVAINGSTRKRPLRVYDAAHGVFGIVLKGECVPVVATGPKSVKLHTKLPAKSADACRAAKLVDLGITRDPKPMPFTRTPKASPSAITPIAAEPVTIESLLAILKAAGVKLA
jgi:hypothetical protein